MYKSISFFVSFFSVFFFLFFVCLSFLFFVGLSFFLFVFVCHFFNQWKAKFSENCETLPDCSGQQLFYSSQQTLTLKNVRSRFFLKVILLEYLFILFYTFSRFYLSISLSQSQEYCEELSNRMFEGVGPFQSLYFDDN